MAASLGRLLFWADGSAPLASGLHDRLLEVFGEVVALDLAQPGDPQADDTVLLFLSGADSEGALSWMERLRTVEPVNVVAVVEDSYLGTDAGREQAMVSGAAVALVRSLAVRRGTTVRANAICVPTSTGGNWTELTGPLPLEPTVDDVMEAIDFLAGPDGGYVSGQVLYVNGGRQLFSSLTS
jgi:hypothetical protein